MAGVNRQTIIGNLGQDPEVRHTQGGTAVCNLWVAVNERVKKGDVWGDHTEWFTVVCFGKTAENAGKYLTKGRQIYAEGPSRFKEYNKKDGSTGYSREIVVGPSGLLFLGGRDGQGGGERSTRGGSNERGEGNGGQQGGSQNQATWKPNDGSFYDDDLHF